jgi:polyisoprenoid-binding protein YceI
LRWLAFTILALLSTANLYAQSGTKLFYANDERKRDVVTFTSKAPLETIVGTTGHITGMVETDPSNIMNTKARFEVDLATIKTGIDMRDGHMRDQYLETSKYPKAIFELTKVVEAEQSRLENQKTFNLKVEGSFTVHGVTRPVTVPIKITYYSESEETKAKLPGDLLRVDATWELLLSDYKISRPQFVILKLDDKQKIEIDVFASTGSPAVSFAESKESQ